MGLPRGCVAVTQLGSGAEFCSPSCCFAAPLLAQSDEFRVYTDAPRLLLTPQRLRLLQRERQRDSLRWNMFNGLISGGAVLPEPGFAWALYYRTSGDSCRGARRRSIGR